MESERFEKSEIDGKDYYRVPPNAVRFVRGMSKLSYEFHEAIADLIDNSIAADAKRVEVVIEQIVGGNVDVRVLDNGHGIKRVDLPAAIQYGADDRDDPHSLGIYGFGLKTACQSFTNKFMIVSKFGMESEVNMLTFDEEIINVHNDYLFASEIAPPLFEKLLTTFSEGGSGTLVITENASRFFTSEDGSSDDKKSKSFVKKRVAETADHLRKVFQRFLDFDDSRAVNVEIVVNGESLTPWDPFCLKEPGVKIESEKKFDGLKTISGNVGNVIMRGYILPAKQEFVDSELYKDAQVGPNTHGVYVYRENRCIVQADYFKLFKRETHLSNLRVEFSYDGTLDELFHTALQKGSMSLGDLEEAVRDFLRPLLREADLRSRGNSRKKDTRDIHNPSQKLILAAESRIHQAKIEAIDDQTARVESKYGSVVLPIRSINDAIEPMPINPVDSINDGHLWQMRLHNGKQVVEINKGHEFYNKIYLPNKGNAAAIRGLDMIFWSLAITEANCSIPDYQRQFREFRFEVSRILRQITDSLPEPKLDLDDDD